MEQEYNNLTEKYQISARKYFWILRLAIYHVDGKDLNTSYEVSQYPKSKEVYEVACRVLKTLYEDKQPCDYTRIRRVIEQGVKHLTDAEIDNLIDLLKRLKEI